MKKLLTLMLLGVILATNSYGGFITSIQGAVAPKIKAKLNQIETAGQNPRAYVFTVDKKDGALVPMQCIMVYTEQDLGESKAKSTAPVLQCIKVK